MAKLLILLIIVAALIAIKALLWVFKNVFGTGSKKKVIYICNVLEQSIRLTPYEPAKQVLFNIMQEANENPISCDEMYKMLSNMVNRYGFDVTAQHMASSIEHDMGLRIDPVADEFDRLFNNDFESR